MATYTFIERVKPSDLPKGITRKPTPSELKYYDERYGKGNFFDRKTMRFFGQTMKSFCTLWARDNATGKIVVISEAKTKYNTKSRHIWKFDENTKAFLLHGSLPDSEIKWEGE